MPQPWVPAEALPTLRPTGSLSRSKATFVTRLQPAPLPHEPLVSYRLLDNSPGGFPPLMIRACGRAAKTGGAGRTTAHHLPSAMYVVCRTHWLTTLVRKPSALCRTSEVAAAVGHAGA